MAFIRHKDEDQMDKIYRTINKDYLTKETIDRDK